MQGKRKNPSKKSALFRTVTPSTSLFPDYEACPVFSKLDKNNRWIKLDSVINWDKIVALYRQVNPTSATGRKPISPRIIIGATIIKHLNDFTDEETVEQIRENPYLQKFLGYPYFTSEAPFDASVFVSIRKRLNTKLLSLINLELVLAKEPAIDLEAVDLKEECNDQQNASFTDSQTANDTTDTTSETHKGKVLFDATVAPQAIAYPTDINLLNDARVKSEEIIDALFKVLKPLKKEQHTTDNHLKVVKPRTYRRKARENYLKVAQSKKLSKSKRRAGIRLQLNYLKRNLGYIESMLDELEVLRATLTFPINKKLQWYYWVIQLLYAQQKEMYDEDKHSIDDRITSIHQPYVRPIVRGKAKNKTEFGAKIHLSLVDGFGHIDELSWDAFNEGKHMEAYIENYKKRFGFYPEKVLADKIYCSRENRKLLKEKGIKLVAKPLGRPSKKASTESVSPGERNPIEGKFGQAKLKYGLERIRAKLSCTSLSWISSIFLVLNLVKLARLNQCVYTFSRCAWVEKAVFLLIRELKTCFSVKVNQKHLKLAHFRCF